MLLTAVVAVAAANVRPALGQVTGDDPFSLRLPAALGRFSSYGDVAGVGNASAASKWSSSVNPAAADWLAIPGKRPVALSPQYSNIAFEEGTRIQVATEAATVSLGDWGTIQPAFAQAWSNRATTRQGLLFDFDLRRYQMNWGKRINEDAAVGAGFQFSTSEVGYDLGSITISKSRSDAYGFTLGTLNRVKGPLLAGAVMQYSFSRDRTKMFAIPAFGVPEEHLQDTTHEITFRPGLSYEYLKDSMVLVDYQFASYFNHEGSIRANRVYAGVDHRIFDWLFVRGGIAMDTGGHTALTCGVGIYPSKTFTIDLGYQENMFPEIQEEFGRSRTLTVSLGVSF